MSDDDSNERPPSGESEAVGYGRPPKKTQFKPGQSGNPRGRPKGSQSLDAILRKAFTRKVRVKQDGKTKTMPVVEAIALSLTQNAMINPRSAHFTLKLVRELESEGVIVNADTRSADELAAEDEEILNRYMRPNGPPGENDVG